MVYFINTNIVRRNHVLKISRNHVGCLCEVTQLSSRKRDKFLREKALEILLNAPDHQVFYMDREGRFYTEASIPKGYVVQTIGK
jgi:hypothetical protein